jgi:hypothetical protein
MSTDFTNWKCDDLTTPQKAELDANLEKERIALAKKLHGSNNSYTNLDDVNDALMENPSLWDNLENL